MELYWQRNGITGKFSMTIKGFIVIKWHCSNSFCNINFIDYNGIEIFTKYRHKKGPRE